MKIRIATRTSPLALLQTNQVISLIESAEPSSVCEIIPIESEGDLTEAPLHLIGGLQGFKGSQGGGCRFGEHHSDSCVEDEDGENYYWLEEGFHCSGDGIGGGEGCS